MKLKLWKVALAFILLGTSCSDDDEVPTQPIEPDTPAIIEGAKDVLNGINSVILPVDKLEKVKLFTKRKIQLKFKEHKFLDFVVEKEGEGQVLRTIIKNKPRREDFPLTCKLDLIIPHLQSRADGKDAEITKSVYMTVQQSKPVPDSPTVTYARKAIGMGMHPWNDLGTVTHPIFNFDEIYWDCSKEEALSPTSKFIEISGEKYTEAMETIGGGLGFSGITKKLSNKKTKNFILTGGLDFDVSKKTDKIDDYEFYMSYYQKKMSTIKCDVNNYLERGLYSILSPTINNILNNPTTKAYQQYPNTKEGIFALFNEYGTHVITKGVFGGRYSVLYGRKSNAYTESIAGQMKATVKTIFPADNPGKAQNWIDVYVAKTQTPNFNANCHVEGSSADIAAATGAFMLVNAKGGNASKDMEAWDKSIDATDASKTSWVVISYSTNDDDENNFIEIKDPRLVIDKARLAAMNEYWEEYLEKHAVETKTSPMILVDFMMKTGANDNQSGDPKPFVAEDDYGVKRVYFPMMANKFAPAKQGYALETSSHYYLIGTNDHKDHYWYYALGRYDNSIPSGRGILDITFARKKKDGYTLRGDCSQDGIVGALDDNYVFVKFADSNSKYENVIKAVALKDQNNKVIASSGGAEMRKPFSNSDFFNSFLNYWKDEQYVSESDAPYFYKGGLSFGTRFKPIYSKKDILVKDFTVRNGEPSISHPTPW